MNDWLYKRNNALNNASDYQTNGLYQTPNARPNRAPFIADIAH